MHRKRSLEGTRNLLRNPLIVRIISLRLAPSFLIYKCDTDINMNSYPHITYKGLPGFSDPMYLHRSK